ncbi:hypothetical protein JCM10135_08560 [Stetteria hydrogenophila]
MKNGDFVLVNYTLWAIEDGEERIIDTTREEVAVKHNIYDARKRYGATLVVIGKTSLLPAVEKALSEMDVGEKKVIIAEPSEAFGERDERLVLRLPKKTLLQRGIRPAVGLELEVGGRRGVITKVTERFVYVDLNHPLAGKRIKIELEVTRKIEDPAEKVKYLASKWIGIPEGEVKVELSNGEALVKLPPSVLGVSDLEARLARFISDVAELVSDVKKVTVKFTVNLEEARGALEGEKEKEEKREAGEAGGAEGSGEGSEASGGAKEAKPQGGAEEASGS